MTNLIEQAYLKKQELTCGSSKTSYCDKECKKSVVQWVMYSDGCVAPNENTLPHPFLDDNGINPVYQKDLVSFLCDCILLL
jgi:hypothetical protein